MVKKFLTTAILFLTLCEVSDFTFVGSSNILEPQNLIPYVFGSGIAFSMSLKLPKSMKEEDRKVHFCKWYFVCEK